MTIEPDDRTPAEVRVWTFHRNGRTATRDAQAHRFGVGLVSAVDGDVVRSEVARTPAAGQALADDWREAFIAKRWTA